MRRGTLLAHVFLLAARTSWSDERVFVIVPQESSVTILVGRAGLLSFAGHRHEIETSGFDGRVVADDRDVDRSSVALRFETGRLRVTGKGEPAKDVPKVQEAMLGPKVLDTARFPHVAFTSRKVTGRSIGPGLYDLRVEGELSLHGVSRSLDLPVHVEIAGNRLEARGRTEIRQSDFGIRPLSVAKVVNVKNEVAIEYKFVARLE